MEICIYIMRNQCDRDENCRILKNLLKLLSNCLLDCRGNIADNEKVLWSVAGIQGTFARTSVDVNY